MDLLSIPSEVLGRMVEVVEKANAILALPCHKAFVVLPDVGLHRAMADSVFNEGFRLADTRQVPHHVACRRVVVGEREAAEHAGILSLREDNHDFHSNLTGA